MPLSAPAPRQHLHTRQIECRGYYREDGLWDIEGHITDVKTYSHHNDFRGELAPGDPVHDMWIRLTIDDRMTIHAVEAVTDSSPYRICPDITPNFQKLVGLRLVGGFHRQVREVLGGVHGCVHLVELLGPVATVAFQTLYSDKALELRRARDAAAGKQRPAEPRPAEARSDGTARPKRPPRVIDSCHAWASDGEVVKRSAPDFYTGPR